MTKNPPQPILDSQTGNSPHGWIPGWISKYWDEDPEHPPFKPGKGMIRRPDVIIVQNPNRPPTQDNIKQVVEMKFPPDPHNREQLEDYAAIAGNKNKIVEMKPSDCDCGQENQRSKVPVEQAGWAVAIAADSTPSGHPVHAYPAGHSTHIRPPVPRPSGRAV
ncbi:VRR-NUC domain-containing protein [Pseudomonas aeruginosa]